MEQVAVSIIKKVNQVEQLVRRTSTPPLIADWLESHGWHWIGGRWASLDFPNPCYTWSFQQALRIQLLRTIAESARLHPSVLRDMKLIQEVAK